jgi:hypothetical protein
VELVKEAFEWARKSDQKGELYAESVTAQLLIALLRQRS